MYTKKIVPQAEYTLIIYVSHHNLIGIICIHIISIIYLESSRVKSIFISTPFEHQIELLLVHQ